MELFKTDKPVDSKAEDKFQRYEFAKRIATIAEGNYQKSLVIGIYGKWGEGKTSLMNFIQRELKKDTIAINFNPWLFHDEKSLIKSFFESIATALKKTLTSRKERAIKLFNEYADAIGSLTEIVIPFSKQGIETAKKLTEKLGKHSIEDLKKRVDNLIIESEANFVVFVDDIDRLDISEVQSVFKLVKLVGDFPRTTYVLSFDDSMVAAALGPKYGDQSTTSGYDFLEKIIQLPLHLPKANAIALREYTLMLLYNVFGNLEVQLTESEQKSFIQNFDEGFMPAIINPRLGVRFANSIGFSLPLLKGEVNLADLITIEGVKVFYPSLYGFIRDNPEIFLRDYSKESFEIVDITGEKNRVKDLLDGKLRNLAVKVQDKIKNLLIDLFPQLKSVYRNYGSSDETYNEWHREMRICSSRHFERYFSYVVQEGDISDVQFHQLLYSLDTIEAEDLSERFAIELPKFNPSDFIFKLLSFVSTFSPKASKVLSIALASNTNYFSKDDQDIVFGTERQSMYLIEKLLLNTPSEDRAQAALIVLNQSLKFHYKLQLGYHFIAEPTRELEQRFVSETEAKELQNFLVESALKEFESRSLFEAMEDYSGWSLFKLFVRAGRVDDANKLLTNQLNLSSQNSLEILKLFCPTVLGYSNIKSHKANFTLETYENLKTVIDVKLLYQKTLEAFGKKEFRPPINPEYGELTDDNLIGVFQKIHRECIVE